MKKVFILLIVLLLWVGNSWAQSIPTSLSNIPEKKVANKIAKHYPTPPAPLGILQGGETIATATVIASLPYSDNGTTIGHLNDYGGDCEYGTSTAPDVVYSYTPAADGAIDVSLCHDATNYDTKLFIFDTPTPVDGDEIACNDDFCSTISYPDPYVSEVSGVPVTGGTTYYIVVDGYGTSAGTYEISVIGGTFIPPPPNDDCIGATVVSGPFPQTVTGTTLGATVDCPGLLNWNAVWYAVTLPYATNNLTVDWCGTENMVEVGVVYYTTCPVVCANYVLYTSNTWQFCDTPTGPETALTSFLSIPGPTTIYYPAYSTPQMDHVLTFNVTEVAGPGCGNTDLGLITPTTTSQSAPYAAGDSYYWSFNATATNLYTFSSCGAGEDTYLRIYDNSGTLVAENDDYGPHCATAEASLDYLATASGLYYVSIAAWSCVPLVNAGNLVYYYTLTVPGCGATNLGLITPTTSPQTAAYTAGDTYYWSFNANAGDTYTFSDCGGLSEDSYIRIYDASFTQIASADDFGPHCATAEASIDWTAPASGLYYVSLAHWSCAPLVNSDNFTYYYTPAPTCPAPTNPATTGITATSAVLEWTPPPIIPDSFFDVFFGPGSDPFDGVLYEGVTSPFTPPELLEPETDYGWYVRSNCGEFNTPRISNFWMALDQGNNLMPGSGGTMDGSPLETGTWYLYDQTGGQWWYNIWFYNDPLDITRMKIIRMGFWIQSYDMVNPGQVFYVVNWSDSLWAGPGFPLPANESHVRRSPVNIRPVTPTAQWVELYFEIPTYNPEWVSVDIWGQNIEILEEMIPPPDTSSLYNWWLQSPGSGGIIVHECLPKPSGNTSTWVGPVNFTTQCNASTLPYAENFDAVVAPAIPDCMSVTNDNSDAYQWITSEGYLRSSPNGMFIRYNSSIATNDWFFTPPLTLAVGEYKVSFWYNSSGYYTEKLEVKWGNAPNAAAMTNGPIFDNNNITNDAFVEGTGYLDVITAGDYFVGWHGYSDADMWYLVVDDISIGIRPFIWTGMVSTVWTDPGNWDRTTAPDASSVVIIPSDPESIPDRFPSIIGTVNCYSITVGVGATVTVLPGGYLNVINP
jgi:hypothetical protein